MTNYKTIHAVTLLVILSMFQACTDEQPNGINSPENSGDHQFEKAAMQDRYISSEQTPFEGDENSPVLVADDRSHSTDTALSIKIVRKTKRTERSILTDRTNDSVTVVLLRTRTSGEAKIILPSSADSIGSTVVLRKPLNEIFERKLLFWENKSGEGRHSDLSGTVSDLMKDPATMNGSFQLIAENRSVTVLYNGSTSFDDTEFGSLKNGDAVEVNLADSPLYNAGISPVLAGSIEYRTNKIKHAGKHWKKSAISLMEGGTAVHQAKITKIHIRLSDSVTVTVRSPLEYYFYFWKLRPHIAFCTPQTPLRFTVHVESTKPDADIVIFRRGNVIRGNVSLKHQLTLTSDTQIGSIHHRIYEGTIPPHGLRGSYHSLLEVWTHESVFDSTAEISTHVWAMPYSVY